MRKYLSLDDFEKLPKPPSRETNWDIPPVGTRVRVYGGMYDLCCGIVGTCACIGDTSIVSIFLTEGGHCHRRPGYFSVIP